MKDELLEELQDARIQELERRVDMLVKALKTTATAFEEQQKFNRIVKDTITGGK